MLYRLVRPLARIAIQVYFREIYLSHAERIPADKPVLLACNHPTGFMEPCILACFLDRPLYFLVRGDFFAKPHFERMLRALHMLPVFRFRDGGFSQLRSNLDTFQACHRALEENRSIMVFAEGSTRLVKQLRPLQKGLVRIAFGSLEAYPELEEVYVVPVGVTYNDVNAFRSKVMIECGQPVLVRPWLEHYRESPNQATQGLLDAVAEGMRRCLVHVPREEDFDLADRLLRLQDTRPPPPKWWFHSTDGQPLRAAQGLNRALSALEAGQRQELLEQLDLLERAMAQAGMPARGVWPVPPPSAARRLGLALTWLPARLGLLLNYPPRAAIRRVVDRRVRTQEFKAPVTVAGGLGFFLFWWLLVALGLGLTLGWLGLLLFLLLPTLGGVAHWRHDAAERARWGSIWASLSPRQRRDWSAWRERVLGAAPPDQERDHSPAREET